MLKNLFPFIDKASVLSKYEINVKSVDLSKLDRRIVIPNLSDFYSFDNLFSVGTLEFKDSFKSKAMGKGLTFNLVEVYPLGLLYFRSNNQFFDLYFLNSFREYNGGYPVKFYVTKVDYYKIAAQLKLLENIDAKNGYYASYKGKVEVAIHDELINYVLGYKKLPENIESVLGRVNSLIDVKPYVEDYYNLSLEEAINYQIIANEDKFKAMFNLIISLIKQLGSNRVHIKNVEEVALKPEILETSDNEVTESLSEPKYDLDRGHSSSIGVNHSSQETSVYDLLKLKLKASNTKKIPLLVGPTGVGKSAYVHEVAEELGFRVIEYRTSFMKNEDLLELLNTEVNSDNKPIFHYSYDLSLVRASDQYMNFIQNTIVLLQNKDEEQQKKLANGEIAKDDSIDYQTEINRLKEETKPPLIFLYEITKANKSVRQVFTQILSEKKVGTELTFKGATMVAATNAFSREGLEGVFASEIFDSDPVFLSKFNILFLEPSDVLPKWKSWATGKDSESKQRIHPKVLEYLDKTGNYYREDLLEEVYNNDPIALSRTPILTFRSWELVSNYLKAKDKAGDKKLLAQVLRGFLGGVFDFDNEDSFKNFISESYEVVELSPEEEMTEFTKECLKYNIPAQLISRLGLGKSSRIKDMAKNSKELFGKPAELISINLSELEPSFILGVPFKESIADALSRGVFSNPNVVDEKMYNEIQKIAKAVELPPTTTTKAPMADFKHRLESALRNNKKVILFFDEMNRVSSPPLMSAVFSAVSDHKLFGIDFKDQDVSIVSAMNLGEVYSDTIEPDPAFAARFAILDKPEYTLGDARSFRKYVEENSKGPAGVRKYSPVLAKYLNEMKDEDLLEFLKKIEQANLKYQVSSTRSITDLGSLLERTDDFSLKGFVNLIDSTELLQATNIASKGAKSPADIEYVKKIVNNTLNGLDSWAGMTEASGRGYVMIDGERRAIDLAFYKEVFESLEDLISTNKVTDVAYFTVFKFIVKEELRIHNFRESIFNNVAGPDFASGFLPFYNKWSNSKVLTIPELVTTELIDKFFKQTTIDELRDDKNVKDMISKFYNEHKDVVLFRYFLVNLLEILSTKVYVNQHEIPDSILKYTVRELIPVEEFWVSFESDFDMLNRIMVAVGRPPIDRKAYDAKRGGVNG